MRFDNPWWLVAAVPVLAIAWLVARKGGRTVPRRQHRAATWVRLAALVLLVMAAAQPILTRAVDDRSVLFLLDRSASISAEAAAEQEEFLILALAEARADAQTAVAVFGRDTASIRPSRAAESRDRCGPSPTTPPPTWQVPWRRQRH